jgi:hypothetical protein
MLWNKSIVLLLVLVTVSPSHSTDGQYLRRNTKETEEEDTALDDPAFWENFFSDHLSSITVSNSDHNAFPFG